MSLSKLTFAIPFVAAQAVWLDNKNCHFDQEWIGQSSDDNYVANSKEECEAWCTSENRGSDYELNLTDEMCCGFEDWNTEDPFSSICFLMRGGVQVDQTEDLENATFSSLIFQFEYLEEYYWDDYFDEYGEEDWEDWYGGCDW